MPQIVRVVRKGNGGASVVPSPIVLRSGEVFVIRNMVVACPASVDFAGVPVDPQKDTIAPSGQRQFTVRSGADPGYYEYDVVLSCERDGTILRAEGGSRPGAIIDG